MPKITQRQKALAEAERCVPTNWLDPLLSGPKAVLPKNFKLLTPRHIEALLRGIQDRIRALR